MQDSQCHMNANKIRPTVWIYMLELPYECKQDIICLLNVYMMYTRFELPYECEKNPNSRTCTLLFDIRMQTMKIANMAFEWWKGITRQKYKASLREVITPLVSRASRSTLCFGDLNKWTASALRRKKAWISSHEPPKMNMHPGLNPYTAAALQSDKRLHVAINACRNECRAWRLRINVKLLAWENKYQNSPRRMARGESCNMSPACLHSCKAFPQQIENRWDCASNTFREINFVPQNSKRVKGLISARLRLSSRLGHGLVLLQLLLSAKL